MPAEHTSTPDEEPAGPVNRLEPHGGVGDVVQARDVHGGVHFHQPVVPFVVTPRQLPSPPRGFVNRDTELTYLATVAIGEPDAPQVVIITGTAGVGKTSLALRCAHRVRDRFPHGQLYTNLRGYDPGSPATAEHALGGFLRDLGVPARAIPTALDDRAGMYRSILAERRMLIVLDNAATVGQVRPLLPGETGCLVIVTSRSHLSGLVAREGARRLQLDLLSDEDAVMLLREVTAGHRPGDDDTELTELAGLCARLPLALRIAAERAASRPMMPLGELIVDLRDESGLWDTLSVEGDADAVRTVFAWSYRSLPDSAAGLFRLLGLHPGTEFSASAAAVLAGVSIPQARRDLDALVGAHLVEHRSPGRYQFHDLLRAYAIDQVNHLDTDQTRTEARRRVLTWYLHTADAAQRRIAPYDRYQLNTPPPADITPLSFDGYQPALGWYRTEATNLVAAVRAAAGAGLHDIAWRLAAVLRGLYMQQNAFDDWITTARIGAESAARIGERAGHAEVLDSLGKALLQSRALSEAEACHRHALSIRREIGDRAGEAVTLNTLGLLELRHRHLDQAAVYFRQGEAIFAELGERRWQQLLRSNLADALSERGDLQTAAELLDTALPVFRELGDRYSEGNALYLYARIYRSLNQLDQARAAIDQALQIATTDDTTMRQAHWLAELARIQLAQHHPDDALTSSRRSAVIHRQLGDRSREAIAIDLTGQAYQHLAWHDDAATLHRRAASIHRELGDRWQLAGTLAHLATTLDHTVDDDQAQTCRQEALALLADFDDPPAVDLHHQLSQMLTVR